MSCIRNSEMRKEIVIADLDGCLWDSKPRRDEFFFHICGKYGKPCPGKKASEMSDGIPRKMEEEYNNLGFNWEADSKMIWGDFIEFFNRFPPDLFGDVFNALYSLKRDGVKSALVTKNSSEVVYPLIERAGIEDLFLAVKTREDGPRGCSKSLLFSQCLEKLKIHPSRAISMGDHIYDISAAEEAGILPVAVGYGGFVRPELLLEKIPERQFAANPEEVYRVIRQNLNNS